MHVDISHWYYFLMILLFSLYICICLPPSMSTNFLFSPLFPPPVCPFCKYLPPLLPLDILIACFVSVFLTLQSSLIVKVLLPHSHLACPSLHSPCGPRVAPSPPRMPISRTVDSWHQVQALGARNSTATLWTWEALMAPQYAPQEEVTIRPWAPGVLASTVTRQRA